MDKFNFKKYFDKIYIINYIEGNERRKYINEQFDYYNIEKNYEFVFGLPFYKIKSLKYSIEKLIKYVPYNTGSLPGVSCALAHYTAVKSAYELGYNSVLIMEDDIILRNDINLIFEYLNEIPKDWNYINFLPGYNKNNFNVHDLNLFLGATEKWLNLKKFVTGSKHEIDCFKPCGFISSACYALDRNAMELYIKIFENNNNITNADLIEYFFNNISQSPLNSYTPSKRLFAVKAELNTLELKDNKYIIKNYGFEIASSPEINSENFKFSLEKQNISIISNINKLKE